mmetsp:Transcript_30377/g.46508  ORF Transcript_30377/g.46508 Transcript_30377/m.46508 type:complete len:108 (-) Transcript_30377:372-695(-)
MKASLAKAAPSNKTSVSQTKAAPTNKTSTSQVKAAPAQNQTNSGPIRLADKRDEPANKTKASFLHGATSPLVLQHAMLETNEPSNVTLQQNQANTSKTAAPASNSTQ